MLTNLFYLSNELRNSSPIGHYTGTFAQLICEWIIKPYGVQIVKIDSNSSYMIYNNRKIKISNESIHQIKKKLRIIK